MCICMFFVYVSMYVVRRAFVSSSVCMRVLMFGLWFARVCESLNGALKFLACLCEGRASCGSEFLLCATRERGILKYCTHIFNHGNIAIIYFSIC